MSITRSRMEHDAYEQVIRLIDSMDFCCIYEDDIIAEGYTEEEQRELFDLILRADIHLTWEGSK